MIKQLNVHFHPFSINFATPVAFRFSGDFVAPHFGSENSQAYAIAADRYSWSRPAVNLFPPKNRLKFKAKRETWVD